jgi:proteasome lid subunit RPN8/RPN11
VVALHAADNRREAEAAPRRFLITAEDYRAIEAAARARSLDMIGFYHSHPDHPAHPSDYDREHAFPWYSYVIVSVRDGRAAETTSWILDDDRAAFAPEPLSTEERGSVPSDPR